MQPEVVGSFDAAASPGSSRRSSRAARASAPPCAGRAADRLRCGRRLERPLGLLLALRHDGRPAGAAPGSPGRSRPWRGPRGPGLVELAQRGPLGGHRLQRGGPVQEPVGGLRVEQRGHRTEPTGPVGRAGELAERRAAGDELGLGLGDLRGESLLALHRGVELGPRVEEALAGLVELVAERPRCRPRRRRGIGGGGRDRKPGGQLLSRTESSAVRCRAAWGMDSCPSVGRRPG